MSSPDASVRRFNLKIELEEKELEARFHLREKEIHLGRNEIRLARTSLKRFADESSDWIRYHVEGYQ